MDIELKINMAVILVFFISTFTIYLCTYLDKTKVGEDPGVIGVIRGYAICVSSLCALYSVIDFFRVI